MRDFYRAASFSLVTVVGGTIDGSLGFDVETAGDSPVWHRSEVDVFPGERQ